MADTKSGLPVAGLIAGLAVAALAVVGVMFSLQPEVAPEAPQPSEGEPIVVVPAAPAPFVVEPFNVPFLGEGHGGAPVFSPKGAQLAFEVHGRGSTRELHVVLMTREGPGEMVPVRPKGEEWDQAKVAGAAWHGANKVLFQATPELKGPSRLFYVQPGPDQQGVPLLSEEHAVGALASVSVSGDGKTLAWIQDADLYTWSRPEDAAPVRRTKTGEDERSPSLSADGKTVLFSRGGLGARDLWTIDLATGAETLLHGGAGDQLRGVWVGNDVVSFSSASQLGTFDVVHHTDGKHTVLGKRVRMPVSGGPAVTSDGAWVLWAGKDQPGHLVAHRLADGEQRVIDTGLSLVDGPVITSGFGQTWLAFSGIPFDAKIQWKGMYVAEVGLALE